MTTEKRFYVSEGNKKLRSNDHVKFLIWNLPAQITCPYATELCKKFCYAKKAERVYPGVLPSRMRNLEFSKSPEFVREMVQYIWKKSRTAMRKGKRIYFRIHESGDFYNVEYVRKWVDITRQCPQVVFLAYTKSIKMFQSVELPYNFIVRASLWDDTPAELREMSMQYPIYTALPKDSYDETLFFKCECKDCGTCLACYRRDMMRIVVDIH